MSLALAYHAATAYSPDTIGGHPGLDWSRQPLPFHRWPAHLPRVPLSDRLPFDPDPFTGATTGRGDSGQPAPGDPLALLATWLFAAYGVTGVADAQPRPLLLRSAPSAGGLYPAELRLAVRDLPGLAPGLYGFDPRQHALIRLGDDDAIAGRIAETAYASAPLAGARVLAVVSGVIERSRWRYRERAYRRILLDSGHVIGGGGLMAPALGWDCHLTTAFHDAGLNDLLALQPAHADPTRQEAALAVLALGERLPARPAWSALPSPPSAGGDPASISEVHAAGDLPARRPAPRALGEAPLTAPPASAARVALPPPTRSSLADGGLWPAIVARRSTRRFTGAGLAWSTLARILDAALRPVEVGLGAQPTADRGLIDLILIAGAVDGLDPGSYRLDGDSGCLHPIRRGADRDRLGQLCLGQELGRDCAAAVVFAADLPRAIALRGDRAYRTLHLDAGILGQRLALAAHGEGLGTSGIGGFFDRLFTDYLGLPSNHAILYPTLIGVPA